MTAQSAASRPSIVVLSFSPIARDPRVLRQVRLFSRLGDVTTVGYGPAPQGVVRHVEIPPDVVPWRTERFVAPLLLWTRQFRRLYFGSPRIQFVQNAIARGSVDVVVANDELAVPVALSLAPRGGVHADLHEYSPSQGSDRLEWRLRVAPFMRWACRAVRRADSATTVAPGISREYLRRFGFDSAVVPNAAPFRPDLSPVEPGSPLRLVHIGIAERARKLEIMIDAVARVEGERPGTVVLDVILAPGQADYIAELTERGTRIAPGVVRVLPPVPFDEMVSTLSGYDVGLFISPPVTFNLAHALPNKFFEYVQARLAVIVGPSPEMAPIVETYGFGIVASAFDAEATAAAIASLTHTDVVRYKQASHAHAQELSAEELSKPWLDAVQSLIAQVPTTQGGAA